MLITQRPSKADNSSAAARNLARLTFAGSCLLSRLTGGLDETNPGNIGVFRKTELLVRRLKHEIYYVQGVPFTRVGG